MMTSAARNERWPELAVEEWTDTRDTLHMWTQIVGKIRLAQAPMVNHWWQVPLYVSPRGLTTSAIPYEDQLFDIEFDFVDHLLHLRSSGGGQRRIKLEPKSVAAFYAETTEAMRELGLDVPIRTTPVEVERAVPFAEDTGLNSYSPDHVHRFWRQLVAADRVMNQFRSHFIGKMSPVHFFWGAMDLAYTRFSGRTAPTHPGGVPNCPDWVMVEGYSHELSSCGFWPGGSAEGSFYAYAYPVGPEGAHYSTELGESLLPYEVVRTASDPEGVLLDFLQTTYDAAAETGNWDRDALEGDPLRLNQSEHTPVPDRPAGGG
jgi:hypothetical protein